MATSPNLNWWIPIKLWRWGAQSISGLPILVCRMYDPFAILYHSWIVQRKQRSTERRLSRASPVCCNIVDTVYKSPASSITRILHFTFQHFSATFLPSPKVNNVKQLNVIPPERSSILPLISSRLSILLKSQAHLSGNSNAQKVKNRLFLHLRSMQRWLLTPRDCQRSSLRTLHRQAWQSKELGMGRTSKLLDESSGWN